jgi:RNA polymerase sigma factor (TIGR02999 family)
VRDAMMDDSSQITALLQRWRDGDAVALERLTPLVYDQLRRLARGHVVRERDKGHLDATALVHEAYLKLVDAGGIDWQDRGHFFAIAARIMRRILVDAARTRTAAKRGGGVELIADAEVLNQVAAADTSRAAEIVAIDDALASLAAIDPRRAQVVELRFFAGLSVEETAQALSVSPQTVMRQWKLARAWLAREVRRAS